MLATLVAEMVCLGDLGTPCLISGLICYIFANTCGVAGRWKYFDMNLGRRLRNQGLSCDHLSGERNEGSEVYL